MIDGHTCIKDDGGTPNRRCLACENERSADDTAEVLRIWQRLNVLAETNYMAAAIVQVAKTVRQM